MKKKIYAVFLLVPYVAMAGWFGPDNYEECVVEKMKGQERTMRGMVQDACEAKFPRPTSIAEFASWGDDRDIKIDWQGQSVRVARNDTPYAITEIALRFSRKECSKTKMVSSYREDSDFNSPIFTFKVKGAIGMPEKGFNSSAYKCAEIINVVGVSKK